MTKKRNISAMIAFCVLAVGFVVMNWLDSGYMWDTLMSVRFRGLLQARERWYMKGGFSSFENIIRYYRINRWGVCDFYTEFSGYFFTALPLLAVVFTVMKKKIPAVIFAALNLLFPALIIVHWVVYNGDANASSWIAYAVASVVLMLFALRVIRRKTLTGRLCFALGIVAAVVSVMLSADIDIDWYRFFRTLPGVLFAAFPLLAVGFAGKRKKIPAVIFATLNLLCTGLLFVVESVVFSACWAVYAAAGVVLLLYALGVIQRKTLLVILFFVLSAASVAATVTLSFYEVRSDWSLREARISAFERYGMRAIWDVKMWYVYGYASTLYPLSRAFLYFALGAGALAFRGKEEPRKVNRPVQAVRPVVMQPVQSAATSAESLRKLEQLARLRDMGALTDEEFAQKKEELLKRM